MTPIGTICNKARNGHRKCKIIYNRVIHLRPAIARTTPVPVQSSGPVEVHMLSGHYHVFEAIAALKSFYRFCSVKYPLVFHDDGSLNPGDIANLNHHFPGIRVIQRREADERVDAYLESTHLRACAKLRHYHATCLRLFDFAMYAEGKPFLQMNSNVLFFRQPTELLAALDQPLSSWTDRYNQEEFDSYTWTAEQVKEHTGLVLLPRINVGLMCLRRDTSSFELFEKCAAIPMLPSMEKMMTYFYEQTLTAIESSRRGAKPFPPCYDIRGIMQKRGVEVTSEHYCHIYRPFFYRHFHNRVAPALKQPQGSSAGVR